MHVQNAPSKEIIWNSCMRTQHPAKIDRGHSSHHSPSLSSPLQLQMYISLNSFPPTFFSWQSSHLPNRRKKKEEEILAGRWQPSPRTHFLQKDKKKKKLLSSHQGTAPSHASEVERSRSLLVVPPSRGSQAPPRQTSHMASDELCCWVSVYVRQSALCQSLR